MDTTTSAIAKLIAEVRERVTSEDYRDKHGHSLPPCALIAKYRADVPTLADTLEAVTRERDERDAKNATIIREYNLLVQENRAVTKERDALREALDTAKEFIALLGITSTNFVGTNAELIHAIDDSVDKCLTALASRATPQEPNDADK